MAASPAVPSLAASIADFVHDPLGYVHFIFPWGEGPLQDESGPREWQADILSEIGEHLQNPKTRHTPLCIAVASGKGIGKSAIVAFVSQWAMSTCEDCKVVVTADTGTQLTTKTWPEISKWFKLALNKAWFNINKESIRIKAKEHEETWRLDRITWSEENAEAFAGLHNKGKRIIVILDEASAVADIIWEKIEGFLTDEDTEIIWLAFGNPTRTEGRFRECFGRFKSAWKRRQIDSRKVEGTNKAELQRQVDAYGEDSDHVRIWIRGEFPRASYNQFISSEDVERARVANVVGYEHLPVVIAFDVARFGDDITWATKRQGRRAWTLGKWRGLDTAEVGEKAIEILKEEEPDALVIDGDGIGGGVVDHLKHYGYTERIYEFHGAPPANDSAKYFNRRAEVWGRMRDWLPHAQIENDPELATDITGPRYGYSAKQQIQLEQKDDMKKRGVASPDGGDSLAMTFSVDVAPKPKKEPPRYVTPGQGEHAWMG